MRGARVVVLIGALVAFVAACTTGTTDVQGLPSPTDTTSPTGPTATGPTGATGPTAAEGGAFSLDFEFPPRGARAGSRADDALRSTSVTVEVDSNIPGIENFFQTFREGETLAIVPGSDRC